MSKKVIEISLTTDGIDRLLKDVRSYQKWVVEKTQELTKALAEEGLNVASVQFASATYDGTNDVSVHIEQRGENQVAVVATGNATLFIEFGSGITYPDSHPDASRLGMVHGQYGYKLGRNPKGWRYKGDPGTNGEVITEGKHAGEVHTYGNPANMCMYNSEKELEQHFEEIARRIFVR